MTRLDTPVNVLEVTGALMNPNGAAVPIAAERALDRLWRRSGAHCHFTDRAAEIGRGDPRGGTSMAHRRLAFTLIACLATTPLAAQQAATPAAKTATERTLFRLEAEWAQGVVKRDAATIRRMTAPRWVYSDESGTMNREQGVAAFTSGPDTVTSAGNDEMRAEVYGNTAVVIGILWMRGHNAQGEFTHRYRYTDTWMKLNGRWQCIASQDYLMPEAKS